MKNIKDFDDFAGQDGYVIVDGTDANTPGGKKLLSTIGGGSAGMTMGETIAVTNDMIITPQGGDQYGWDNYIEITVENNKYTEINIPNGLKRVGFIKLYITSTEMPNFIYHIKNKDTSLYSSSGIVVEVHYRATESDTYTQFDHYSPLEAAAYYDSEHAPLAYGPNSSNGFIGESIVTCIGRYFEIKRLYTHVPPSGSWNGIYS